LCPGAVERKRASEGSSLQFNEEKPDNRGHGWGWLAVIRVGYHQIWGWVSELFWMKREQSSSCFGRKARDNGDLSSNNEGVEEGRKKEKGWGEGKDGFGQNCSLRGGKNLAIL
jgi:hypothetical protein